MWAPHQSGPDGFLCPQEAALFCNWLSLVIALYKSTPACNPVKMTRSMREWWCGGWENDDVKDESFWFRCLTTLWSVRGGVRINHVNPSSSANIQSPQYLNIASNIHQILHIIMPSLHISSYLHAITDHCHAITGLPWCFTPGQITALIQNEYARLQNISREYSTTSFSKL